jgi:hypothetical protein
VKVSTAARLSLVKVNRDCAAISDDAEESSLLVPSSAADAGAYGTGHRIRLNAPLRMAYSSPAAGVAHVSAHVGRLEPLLD